MYWTEILTAVALLLVIEGILPFVGPDRYKRLVAQLAELSDNQLRAVGFGSMLAGLVLLFVVRG